MNMQKVLCSIPLIFLLVSVVHAADNTATYIQIDILQLDTEIGNNDANPTALRGKFGKILGENLAVEGIIALGIGDDNITANTKTELNNMYGVNLHGMFQATQKTELFINLGLTTIDMEFAQDSVDDTGISFGAGIAYAIDQGGQITFEYSQLPDIDVGGGDLENTGISLGYKVNL